MIDYWKKTGLKFVLPVIFGTLLTGASAFSMAEDSVSTEYRIKAAFLYNFSRFVTWPGETGEVAGTFNLCIFGGDPFGQLLDALAGKSVHKSLLEVKRIKNPDEARECQIIFIGNTSDRRS